MARAAIIENGTVTSVVVADDPVAVGGVACNKSVGIGWSYDGSTFAPPPKPTATKDDLFEAAASKRWRVETSGIVLAGLPVQTDDRAKTLIAGAASSNEPDTAMLKLKVGHGTAWVDVNFGQIRAMQDAITTHVQACFATEAAVAAEIDAGTITDIAGIDAASWPSNTG